MNDKTPDLPELSDEAVARIEHAVFDEIDAERPRPAPVADRSAVRRHRWLTGAGIAAAFVVGVLVTPPILNAVGGSATSTAESGEMLTGGTAQDSNGVSPDRSAPQSVSEAAPGADASASAPGAVDGADREIVATGYVTLEVNDIAKAADEISTLAAERGGYVESTEVGRSSTVDDTSMPTPPASGYGWISIRVPSAELTAVIDALGDSGEIVSSSISQQDVTSTAIDLRARVDATKASVQRLTEIMAQSGSVSELIEAEVALTDRQAQLESYEQQLAALDDQVAMSSVQVQLTKANAPTTADPAGFGDGVLAGWNGLVVSLNALVIAVGFLLPWLAVAAVVVLIVWLVRRTRRRRRLARADAAPAPGED
ncbi:DUF4349 domain-containing protein [Microbacterium hydrocarbonoxydans]|uniref:DUF4349 domain-containing protein n=1 Tax=Microbacterium hydrocarbonoxydans TaxID=273678 RepID=UPI00203FCBB6|nr:DUF4349 domain-containing protein [Microbacterium hydrocarbonoxydans]MCM3779053.1 DUF4349 domain-containing protein [Microbacterium hydrocarbonoxydans]